MMIGLGKCVNECERWTAAYLPVMLSLPVVE